MGRIGPIGGDEGSLIDLASVLEHYANQLSAEALRANNEIRQCVSAHSPATDWADAVRARNQALQDAARLFHAAIAARTAQVRVTERATFVEDASIIPSFSSSSSSSSSSTIMTAATRSQVMVEKTTPLNDVLLCPIPEFIPDDREGDFAVDPEPLRVAVKETAKVLRAGHDRRVAFAAAQADAIKTAKLRAKTAAEALRALRERAAPTCDIFSALVEQMALVSALELLAPELKSARRDQRSAQRTVEDIVDAERLDTDPTLIRARARLERKTTALAALRRRQDGILGAALRATELAEVDMKEAEKRACASSATSNSLGKDKKTTDIQGKMQQRAVVPGLFPDLHVAAERLVVSPRSVVASVGGMAPSTISAPNSSLTAFSVSSSASSSNAGAVTVASTAAAVSASAAAAAAAAAASDGLSQRARERRHAEDLLRADGLLLPGRTLADYDANNLPDTLYAATRSRAHILGRRLRGLNGRDDLKVLKQLPVGAYRLVKGAIAAAGRLRHPGVVPVECAFVTQDGDTVVLQTPFFAGGNAHSWCRANGPRSHAARLSACARLAEAVAFCHSHAVAHRDIKPANVVFSDTSDAAQPALCDFDVSVDLDETATRLVRGTPLYMAPEAVATPGGVSRAADVYALGVTLAEIFVFCGEEGRLPVKGGRVGGYSSSAGSVVRSGDDLALQAAVASAPSSATTYLDRTALCAQLRAWEHADPVLGDLICAMLSDAPESRPTAAFSAITLSQAANEAVLELDRAECLICGETIPRANGVTCNSKDEPYAADADAAAANAAAAGTDAKLEQHIKDESHFVCRDCFGQDLQMRQIELLSDTCRAATCCVPGCLARPFTHRQVALYAPPQVFDAFCQALLTLELQRKEAQFTERLERERERMLRASQVEMQAAVARKHIEERIMQLHCPQCRRAFYDFTGCMALTCDPGCGATFCGICLRDCGRDAHAHVAVCEWNTGRHTGQGIFAEPGAWRAMVQRRQRAELQRYLAGLELEAQQLLSSDAYVTTTCRELGLPLPGATAQDPVNTAAVAQLRGLGFADPIRIRRALQAAGGNVMAAADALLANRN